jgi:hypothetical protein
MNSNKQKTDTAMFYIMHTLTMFAHLNKSLPAKKEGHKISYMLTDTNVLSLLIRQVYKVLRHENKELLLPPDFFCSET